MILYEDEAFLAVEKPSGLRMTFEGRPGEVEEFLERCVGRAPAGAMRAVHRLDAGTSGVVLLAKSADAHRAALRLFQEHRVRKLYRALAWGHPVPASGVIESPLARRRDDRRRMRGSAAGKRAVTAYRTLRRALSVAHLELEPLTGRTHQIRVHLAEKGHPIVGDDLYGGARWRGVSDPRLRDVLRSVPRLLLHATSLELAHPLTGAPLRIVSPEPVELTEVLEVALAARQRA